MLANTEQGHFKVSDGPLLEQYSQAIVLARKAYAELAANGPIAASGKRSPWVDILEKSHRSSVALAGRLRLAPQMRENSRDAARRAKGTPPSIYEVLGYDRDE